MYPRAVRINVLAANQYESNPCAATQACL